jgi:cellulose synthase/poly-beta-1,6-N-acetylglucosamine synthase-like glycosyltransferase
MCNGANMAYLKKIFIEVNGYEGVDHTPSGDDEFLMHKILKKYPEKIFFLKSIDAVVSTHANTTWKQLIHQRKRWAGKWKLYEDTRTKILGLVLAFVSLSFIASIILTALGLFSISVFTWTLIAKIVIESAVISTLLSFFGKRVSFFSQIVFSIIYPFYIIFLGISANIGKFEWKDRTLSS